MPRSASSSPWQISGASRMLRPRVFWRLAWVGRRFELGEESFRGIRQVQSSAPAVQAVSPAGQVGSAGAGSHLSVDLGADAAAVRAGQLVEGVRGAVGFRGFDHLWVVGRGTGPGAGDGGDPRAAAQFFRREPGCGCPVPCGCSPLWRRAFQPRPGLGRGLPSSAGGPGAPAFRCGRRRWP